MGSNEVPMRFVRVSQDEFAAGRKLYEGVMSYACHGLFFREGESIADSVAKEIPPNEDLPTGARRVLIARGWVEDIQFGRNEARARGSIEVTPGSESETCHRLRGIVSRLNELQGKGKAKFSEVECESTGSLHCVFRAGGV